MAAKRKTEQRLVQVPRNDEPAPEQRVEDKQTGRLGLSEAGSENDGATSSEDSPEAAEQPELIFSMHDAVPQDEHHPARRDGPTIGPIVATDDGLDFADGKVRNLDDLLALYPIGDGDHYISVKRKHPMAYEGQRISGVQRPINRTGYSMEKFIKDYGSGTYELQAYGHPRRGARLDAGGRPRRVALTQPIRLDIPDPFGGLPPNPEAAQLTEETDDMAETRYRNVTPGGAKMRESELEFDKYSQERQDRLQKEREERRERREREREEQRRHDEEEAARRQVDVAQVISEREEANQRRYADLVAQQTADLREQLRASQHLIEELRSQATKGPDMHGMADLIKATRHEGPSAADLQRIEDRHRQEVQHLTQLHQGAIERMERAHADDIRRLEERARESAQQARERIQEVERREADRMRQKEEETERRLNDMARQHEAALAQESRAHQRDRDVWNRTAEMQTSSTKQGYELQIASLSQELTRIRNESAELRTELENEKKKTLAERLDEARLTAEALGYVKSDGSDTPRDWKAMLAERAGDLIGGLPSALAVMAQQAQARAVAQAQPQQPAQPQQASLHAQPTRAFPAASPSPPIQNYPAHATPMASEDEDLPNYIASYAQPAAEAPPPSTPTPAPPQQPPAQASPSAAAPAQTGPGENARPQSHAMVRAESSQEPAPPTEPPVQQPQQPAQQPAAPQQLVNQLAPVFQRAYDEGADPKSFAEGMVGQVGAEQVKQIIGAISAENIVKQLPADHVLSRRDGRRWLSDVWKAAGEIVQT